MRNVLLSTLLAAAATAAVGTAQAATVSFGATSGNYTGDCTPSCTPQFQTIYSASAFGSAPVEITGISYYLASSYAPNIQNYTISLSTSKNSVANISYDFAANIGSDVAQFYSGVPTAPAEGGWVTFSGTPFVYDPTQGDLLVDIEHPWSDFALLSSYDGSSYGDGVSRVYSFSPTGGAQGSDQGYNIATQFTIGPVAGVPEPATWAMMLVGVGAVGGALRSRRKFAADVATA
jgi:hypothetical protein